MGGQVEKFDKSIKIKACKEHLVNGKSFTRVANELSIHRSSVRNWVLIYTNHGPDGFDARSTSNRISKEIKNLALKEYLSGESSAVLIASKYNISSTAILSWVKKHYDVSKNPNKRIKGEIADMNYKTTTFEERLKIVLWTIDHNNSYTKASKKFDVPVSTIRSWLKRYTQEGEMGLTYKKKTKKVVLDDSSLTEVERLKLELEKERALRKEKEFEVEVLKKKEEFEKKNRYPR